VSEHDLLLEWLTVRGDVGTAAADRACGELAERAGLAPRSDRPPRQWRWRLRERFLSPLHRAGHVEFDPARRRWAVVTATAVWSARRREADLLGARSRPLAERLRAHFGGHFVVEDQAGGPQCWRLRIERETLAGVPDLALTDERGGDLLACLPALEGALTHSIAVQLAPRAVWRALSFKPDGQYYWEKLPDAPAGRDGLFRETTPGGRSRWLHLSGNRAAELRTAEQRALAFWLVRARASCGAVECHRGAGELVLYVRGLPPPLLVDRGLRLASGRPPDRQAGRWTYAYIDPDRAGHTARILMTPLTVKP
jgi:hypothetical protein